MSKVTVRQRIGFTLIELWVVVTVIVPGAPGPALLSTALDKEIYQAELAVCGPSPALRV